MPHGNGRTSTGKMDNRLNIPVLTVTGSDSTGGSGVQADIKTIVALGGYAVSAITSVTVQNTLGIQDFFDLPADIVAGQIEAIMDDVQPVAVKVGMVRSAAVADAVEAALRRYAPQYVVYDPIAVSASGDVLMTADVAQRIRQRLLGLCTLVVLDRETAQLLLERNINTQEELAAAARTLTDMGCKAVLLQGSRLFPSTSTDILLTADAADSPVFYSSPVMSTALHGIGGTLSSAIATYLALGNGIADSVAKAKSYINQQIAYANHLQGRGAELYNQFVDLIAAHFRTSSDVRFYAEHLNVSSRYLLQVTRRTAGKTPKMLIDEFLTAQAKTLLDDGRHTVQQVAYELGFKQQAHFTSFFKKMTGTAPSKYRKT